MIRKHRGAIGFAFLVVACFGAWYAGNWACYRIIIGGDEPLARILPRTVNLVGIKLEGERIVISNRIAQLVKGSATEFKMGDEPAAPASAPKIPMKALIAALKGEPEGVAELVVALNKLDLEMNPPADATFDAVDVMAACSGDEVKRASLEAALNTRLDGGPVEELIKPLLVSGIFVRVPVPVQVPMPGGPRRVVAEVVLPYRTRLVTSVMSHPLIKARFDPSAEALAGVYLEVAKAQEATGRENVKAALEALVSAERLRRLAEPVERLLDRVYVLLTEQEMVSARLERPVEESGGTHTLEIEVTRLGRDRLWQYTHENPGCQLLFVVDGVAIAAPVVSHEMKYSTVAITNIADEDLAADAVNVIASHRQANRK